VDNYVENLIIYSDKFINYPPSKVPKQSPSVDMKGKIDVKKSTIALYLSRDILESYTHLKSRGLDHKKGISFKKGARSRIKYSTLNS